MRLFSDAASRVPDPHLLRALELAARGRGLTAPNPAVGCVIVNDGVVVGEGFHPRAGQPHAEVFALAQAGLRAQGSTAYVTLEPCAHHGKTPPCADALIAAGVTAVVIGMPDPNPVAVGGAAKLRDAGISVSFAADATPFIELNEGWLHRVTTGRPLVTVKLGLSLDAAVARTSGRPSSITGASGSIVTAAMRTHADAVLVSAATVIADDPALTRRTQDGHLLEQQPTRVVLVRELVPMPDARVFTDQAAPTIVLASGDHGAGTADALARLSGAGIDVTQVPREGLMAPFEALGARGVSEVLVEAGPRLIAALWAQRAFDALVTVTAGGQAGGDAAHLVGEGEWDAGHTDELIHRLAPLEAGIVGDVSVTQWRPRGSRAGEQQTKGSS